MPRFFVTSLSLFLVSPLFGCRTTASSDVAYAKSSTTVKAIRAQSCHDFKKVESCILRLHGYIADANVLDSLTDKGGVLDTQGYDVKKSELAALRLYTGSLYKNINAALRGSSSDWDTYQNVIYASASALTKLSTLTVKGAVYRSENASADKLPLFLDTYKVNNIILETPFLSATSNATLNFAIPDSKQMLLRYVIQSKTAVDVSRFAELPQEQEVIFAPGAVFRVTSLTRSKIDSVEHSDEGPPVASVAADVLNIGLEEIDPL
ncbi:MAG: hypothetical protein H7249_08145 [Chitinophagaceae bacterium]|nr:hypothetical protein [Oligoflexus sp.]